MKSVTTEKFRQLYAQAPPDGRKKIKRAYQLWQLNPAPPDSTTTSAIFRVAAERVTSTRNFSRMVRLGADIFFMGSHLD